MRLIDADALKKAFCNHCDGDEPCTEPCIDIGLIETAPTIDAVEVVHGEWIMYPISEGMNQCSKCGVLRFGESNYCPNCGAKMKGEQK